MQTEKKNVLEANLALTSKPMLCTSAERILILDSIKSLYNDLPQPLAFSKTLSTLLSRVSTPIEEYDLIAGRCVDRELTDEEERIFKSFIKHPDRAETRAFLGSGHCTYSWDMVVELGLCGMRQKALEQLERESNEDKKIFLEAILEIYGAIRDYMLRYAEAARQRGLCDLADNLKKAATERPDSFAAALQLLWIITLINCAYITENPTLTVGRLDKILYPLYVKDIERGTLTRESAKDYVTDYYCKHNLIMGRGEHQVGDESNSTTFKRICNFDAPQYLLLAGTDEDGNTVINELTQLFAECIVPSFKNPVVVVRYVKDMNLTHPELWKTLSEKALESSSLMFYNDAIVSTTLKRIGLSAAEASEYAHFGCNWCSTGDNGAWMIGGPCSDKYSTGLSAEEKRALCVPYMRCNSECSWPEDFMVALRRIYAEKGESFEIDELYSAFFARMADFIDRKLSYLSRELKARKIRPATVLNFTDCFLRSSLENAECFSASAKYHFEIQSFQMFGTVADCFIAVDQLVLREKRLTLGRLLEATDANFIGYPDVLALCRNAEKYGMDTPLSNMHVERLSRTASDLVIEKNRPYFDAQRLFLAPCIQSDTWHLKMGELFGATPDGRLANTPFSQNLRPSNGACVNGMSAMFNSIARLPQDGLLSGSLNLDVDQKQFPPDSPVFAAMLATYFNNGGMHAQVTSSNLQALIDAQKNPNDHRDIRVRVTGYSGIFVDICERLQNDIIERLK